MATEREGMMERTRELAWQDGGVWESLFLSRWRGRCDCLCLCAGCLISELVVEALSVHLEGVLS